MHTDPELLSLLALGEQVGTGEDRVHVAACPECAGELSELRRLVALGRGVGGESAMAAPSPDVWARIKDVLALEPALEPPKDQSPWRPAVDLTSTDVRTVDAAAATWPGNMYPQRSLLAVVESALAGSSSGSSDGLIAQASLAPIEALWSDAAGEAVLATDMVGRRILQVAVRANLPSSGLRQAWLVHRHDPSLKQTLGILDGPFGVWSVDRSIDLEQYGILDISQQGANDTEHSGHTIVRGQLTPGPRS